VNGRRFIFTAAEMAVYHGGNRGKADVLPCVLVIDAPDDLLAALRDGRNPATASSTAALPADPSTGAPGDGEAGRGVGARRRGGVGWEARPRFLHHR
jgi:hypothetical protein